MSERYTDEQLDRIGAWINSEPTPKTLDQDAEDLKQWLAERGLSLSATRDAVWLERPKRPGSKQLDWRRM